MGRRLGALLVGLALSFWAGRASAASLADVKFWAGSGSKSAALVIDFNDGKARDSLLWGYHWDGVATGEQMLRAVVAADPELYLSVSRPGTYGVTTFGLGYDATGGNDFALTPAMAFTDRVHVSDSFDGNDGFSPVNSLDHYQGGWNSGYWSYWAKPDAAAAWDYPDAGMTDRVLTDGAWDGWSFADFAVSYGVAPREPTAATPEPAALGGAAAIGLLALRRRRRAVAAVTALVAAGAAASSASAYDASDFAVAVVSSTGLPGTGPYNDPAAVLGRPTLTFNNGTAANPDLRRAKLIEGVFNTGPAGEKLITTFNAGQSLTVRMGHAVTDDPSHPFGIDFNVFGNAFLQPGNTGGFTGDDTNLNTTTVGSIFAEDVRVSVSPDNVNWYSYSSGPTGDGYYPTNSYRWDRSSASWSQDLLDPTKAVDPSLAGTLSGKTAADVLDLYNGAAGGAGFDLAESGFSSINYVRFDGLTGYSGGEIDAVAAVPEPAMISAVGLLTAGMLRRRAK